MVILYSVIIMLSISLVMGLIIVICAKLFEVKIDPKVKKILEILPGYNCGVCGYPGCEPYAENIIENEASVTLCTPGGKDVLENIKRILKEEE